MTLEAVLASGNHADALAALRAACAGGDDSPVTRLNLAIAENRAGNWGHARAMMREVAAQLPEWDEPGLRIAESLRATGLLADAERAYAEVLEINPHREEALVASAALMLQRGDAAGARPLLLRCLGVAPARAEAWDALGLALTLDGEHALADSAYAEAQRLAPEELGYALHRVEAAVAAGSGDAELARLEIAAEDDPLNPTLLAARGLLLERLGRRHDAIEVLEAATALAPQAAGPAKLLGGLLARSHRLREAEATLRRAIELDPDDRQLRNDRAVVLMRLYRHAEARDELRTLLDRYGPDANVLGNLSNATVSLGLQEEAVELARQAIMTAPDLPGPRRALANTLPYHPHVDGTALLTALTECSDRLPRDPAPIFASTCDPERPLRIGLLSGTLKTHPVGWLTIAGFENLEPAAFAIICLAQNTADDPIARRFRAIAREWHETNALDDRALAAKARALGIDILIDLGGHGDLSRMVACTHRLAPVQVKWVGMQNHSSGLPEMDWIITDRWETPPELERFYTERMLRLPDGYVCYSPPSYAPDVAPPPALVNGYVTYGCFNNLAKITRRVIESWAGIIHRTPHARMVLKTNQFSHAETSDRVRAAFAYHGIESERLELRGSSPHRRFLAEYNDIDIVLDPFPYSGGLTTCEALWMGVPTVTLPGETFASRHSMSHLSNVGLADWVATDLAGYADLAVTKASDIASLATLRAGLRAQVKAGPLCDAPRFGRQLGDSLRLAWRVWCAQR